MVSRVILLCATTAFWSFAGCGGPDEPVTPPTSQVTGVVHIDGKPVPYVQVFLFPSDNIPGGVDPNTGAPHRGATDADGKFQISTFKLGDGVPVGEYQIAFYWAGNPKPNPLANADEQPVDPAANRFNLKYGNPAKPVIDPVKVEEGKPVDLGVIELKSK